MILLEINLNILLVYNDFEYIEVIIEDMGRQDIETSKTIIKTMNTYFMMSNNFKVKK